MSAAASCLARFNFVQHCLEVDTPVHVRRCTGIVHSSIYVTCAEPKSEGILGGIKRKAGPRDTRAAAVGPEGGHFDEEQFAIVHVSV
jgi:16S rRNA U1498 N3-methylase RsmE